MSLHRFFYGFTAKDSSHSTCHIRLPVDFTPGYVCCRCNVGHALVVAYQIHRNSYICLLTRNGRSGGIGMLGYNNTALINKLSCIFLFEQIIVPFICILNRHHCILYHRTHSQQKRCVSRYNLGIRICTYISDSRLFSCNHP